MSALRVSVVMPVRNAERYVVDAVQSILEQTLRELELIIIDDGSTDRSSELLATLERADTRVRVHRLDGAGVVVALNAGCAEARSPLIARMDADDVAEPSRLEREVALLDARPEVVLVGTAFRFLSAEGRVFGVVRYPTESERLRRDLLRYNCFAHPSVVFRRDAFEGAGGYRLETAEDYDLWLRLAERGDVANLAEPLLRYRHHAAQESLARLDEQAAAALVAQAAARVRRGGGADPLPSRPVGVREALAAVSIAPEELARERRRRYIRWAALLHESGASDGAHELLAAAGGSAAMTTAAWRLERAKVAARSARRLRAAALVAGAFAASPVSLLRALAERRRR